MLSKPEASTGASATTHSTCRFAEYIGYVLHKYTHFPPDLGMKPLTEVDFLKKVCLFEHTKCLFFLF